MVGAVASDGIKYEIKLSTRDSFHNLVSSFEYCYYFHEYREISLDSEDERDDEIIVFIVQRYIVWKLIAKWTRDLLIFIWRWAMRNLVLIYEYDFVIYEIFDFRRLIFESEYI